MAVHGAATITARGVSFAYGRQQILDGIDVVVAPGDRIGVVAPNGTGKTTLLRILAGDLRPDSGTVTIAPPIATIGYLPQERERRKDETVHDFLARRTGTAAADRELTEAASALGADEPGAGERYASALERWTSLGAVDFEARVAPLWSELGLDARLLSQSTVSLSGGEAARMTLAGILLSQYDIFLLDEPTNDLDFDSLERLEDFVDATPAGMVVVSHDRTFLERTVHDVLELDAHTHQGHLFRGSWTAYLDEQAAARRHAEEAYEEYSTKRQALLQRARGQRQWAATGARAAKKRPKDNDKAQRDFFINRTEKQASKVRITEKALNRLDDNAADKPWEPWDLRFEITMSGRAGAVVGRLRDAVVRRGDFTLGPVDLDVGWGERIAILGPNGSGKTTLLDSLLGRHDLDSGSAQLGPSTVVGEIGQARSAFTTKAALIDAFTSAAGGCAPGEARTLLAKFGLAADHVVRPAASLSPGERTRAELALLQARGVNCLVLDEPTNHLDLPAIEQLELALDRFPGTVLLVTHDRRLLEGVRIDRVVRLASGQIAQ